MAHLAMPKVNTQIAGKDGKTKQQQKTATDSGLQKNKA
jgi:hypothetical protein